MKAEVTIAIRIDETVTVDLANPFADSALERAKELLDKLAATSSSLRPLLESVATKRVVDPPGDPPPARAVETNGHTPRTPGRSSGSPATARRERRKFTEEQKRAGATLAREVGAAKAAEEFDVVPTVVRGWLKKHPKEHAVAEPIRGTPPAVGESRDDWEARKREAAGSSL